MLRLATEPSHNPKDEGYLNDFLFAKLRRECHGIWKAGRSRGCICDMKLEGEEEKGVL